MDTSKLCQKWLTGPKIFISIITFLSPLAGCRGAHVSNPTLPAGVINISNNKTTSIAPTAAASGNRVYVAWTDQVGPQNFAIFLSHSTDGGATFDAPINVSQSDGPSGNAQIALSGTNIYVAWEQFVPTNTAENNETDIFFRHADDQNGTLVWDPPLSAPGKNLSASPPICGPAKKAPCPSQNIAIAASGDNIFIAWGEATDYAIAQIAIGQAATEFKLFNSDILMVESFDRGNTFSGPIDLSGPKSSGTPCANATESTSINPTLAASAGGPLYAAWEDCNQPNAKILFRRFPNQQNLISVPPLTQSAITLSGDIKGSTQPSLAADGNTLFLVWDALPFPDSQCPLSGPDGAPLANSEILLIRLDDQGVMLTNPDDLTQSDFSNTACSSNKPKIVFSPPFVYVTWEDSTPGVNGISFKKSTDGGLTFNTRTSLFETGGSSANPALAASGSALFAFWEDATLGNLEILFTRL